MRPRGIAWRAATIAAALALLGACAAPLPEPNPDPRPLNPAPVLGQQQETEVVTAVGQVVAAADAARDPGLATPRVFGPALTIRTAELAVATVIGNNDLVTELPTDTQQVVIPTTQTWPRTMYTVSVQPQNLQSPRLAALEQTAPRELYRLWGWVRLFPGVTLPSFADPTIGSEAVAPDDRNLVSTPADAVNQYADVLNLGENSAYIGSFSDDPFRVLLTDRAKPWQEGLAVAKGTYTMVFSMTQGERVRAVRTADGGALVIGALSAAESMVAEEGAKVPPGTDREKAFFGDTEVTHSLHMTYQDLVALYVPATGAPDPHIQVLGFEHALTGVTP